MGRSNANQTGHLAFSLAVALTCSGPAAFCLADSAATSALAGRIVSVNLVNADDLSPVSSAGEDLSLAVRPAEIGPATNIYQLLQANGVAPDSEAFTVVYDLNPTLRDLKSIRPGTSLRLPRLANEAVLAKARSGGHLAMLTVDAEIRETLNHSVETLQRAAASFARLPDTRFSAQGQTVQAQVASLKDWYAEIRRSFLRRTGPALRRNSLLQLRQEAYELNSMLEVAISGKGKPTEIEVRQIAAIHEDVELAMTNYAQELSNEPPRADALYRVVVNISGASAKSLGRVRVYYTNYGLFHDPPGKECDAFRTPGSGASELMRIQNYMIWAAQDGDPEHPVTEPLRVKIRPWDGEPILVTLNARRRLR